VIADHLAQARRRAADADIDDLGQRIALELAERATLSGIMPWSTAGAAPRPRESLRALSAVTGLATNAAPISRARATISSWMLAVMIASGMSGRSARSSAREFQPVLLGHVEIDQREVDSACRNTLERLRGAAASTFCHSG
jgi:hypothetical protein